MRWAGGQFGEGNVPDRHDGHAMRHDTVYRREHFKAHARELPVYTQKRYLFRQQLVHKSAQENALTNLALRPVGPEAWHECPALFPILRKLDNERLCGRFLHAEKASTPFYFRKIPREEGKLLESSHWSSCTADRDADEHLRSFHEFVGLSAR